jgi:ankyrin repeat protein
MYDPADYDKIKDIYFIEEVKDLKFIKRFSQIKRLNLESDIIENIESLSYLKNIEELEINLKKIDGWDPMADFSPIGNLKTLKKLKIYGRKEIADISPIRNLVNLEELVIGGEIKINDMNPVFDLSSLKKLDLPFLNQPSPEQISKLVNLEYFESPVVLDNKLLNSLIKLKHLKNIKIWYVAAKDISPLLKLPGFKKMEKLLDLHETIHVCNIIYHKGYPPAGYIEDLDAGIKVLEQILQAGENPNEKKNAGYLYREDSGGIYFLEADITPLMQSRVPKITELLIKYGARVNDQDEYGRTALMISSYFDGISSNEYMNKINENIIAKLLIDNGADINKKNKTGQTALHFAVIGLNFASIKLLTEKGADLTIRDNNGLTPIMAASYFHYYGNYNKYEEITEILTKAGAVKNNDDINIINELKWENEYHNVDDGLNIEYGER